MTAMRGLWDMEPPLLCVPRHIVTRGRRSQNAHARTARARCAAPLPPCPGGRRCFISAMSRASDNPADPFKKALTETTKVMADDAELAVSFSVDPPGMTGDAMRLPQVTRRMTRDEVLAGARHRRRLRAQAAVPQRRHACALHAAGPDGARPLRGDGDRALRGGGRKHMPGTASNIDARIAHEAERKGYAQIRSQAEAPLPVAAGYLIRQMATGGRCPRAPRRSPTCGGPSSNPRPAARWRGSKCAGRPAAFARFARKVIEDLGYGDQLGDDPDDQGEEGGKRRGGRGRRPREPRFPGRQEEQDDSDAAEDGPRQESAEMEAVYDDSAEDELAEETEAPQAEAPPEPPVPPPHSDADPELHRLRHRFRRGGDRRGSGRSPPSWNACAPISTSSSSR
jgi:cobaltochelatase CobT